MFLTKDRERDKFYFIALFLMRKLILSITSMFAVVLFLVGVRGVYAETLSVPLKGFIDTNNTYYPKPTPAASKMVGGVNTSNGYLLTPLVNTNDTANAQWTPYTAYNAVFAVPMYVDIGTIPVGSTIDAVYLAIVGYISTDNQGYGPYPSLTSQAISSPQYYSTTGTACGMTNTEKAKFNSPTTQTLKTGQFDPTDADCTSVITDWMAGKSLALRFSNSTSQTGNVDTLNLTILYTPPSVNIASNSAKLTPEKSDIKLDFNGAFAYYDIDQVCKIDVYEKYNSVVSPDWVARVIWYFNDRANSTVTRSLGGIMYYGRLDASPANDRDYYADGIVVPFHDSGTVEYPLSSSCWIETCDVNNQNCVVGDPYDIRQGVSGDFDPNHYFSTFKLSPAGTSNLASPIYPDCGVDFVCSFQNWLKKLFYDLFTPSATRQKPYIELARQTLLSKKPFAYVMPLFQLDFSTPATSSANLMSVPIYINGGVTNYAGDDPTGIVSGMFVSMKVVFRYILWGGFLVYIYLLVRRII